MKAKTENEFCTCKSNEFSVRVKSAYTSTNRHIVHVLTTFFILRDVHVPLDYMIFFKLTMKAV